MNVTNIYNALCTFCSFVSEQKIPICYAWLFCFVIYVAYFIRGLIQSWLKWISPTKRNFILHQIKEAIENNRTVDAMCLLEKYPQYINDYLNDYKYTPFLLACLHGNGQLVKFMLHRNAYVHSMTVRKESAFYLAAFYLISNPNSLNATCIRELYCAGANINEPNCKGYTPLHLAAMFGHASLAKWLLDKGADYRILPNPVELASSQGHLKTAAVILDWQEEKKFLSIENN